MRFNRLEAVNPPSSGLESCGKSNAAGSGAGAGFDGSGASRRHNAAPDPGPILPPGAVTDTNVLCFWASGPVSRVHRGLSRTLAVPPDPL